MFLRGQKSLTQRRAQYYNVVDTNTDGGRGAVIRRLTAVETLGCAQVICSDKTGTLTQNRMTVTECAGSDEHLLATAMALCADAVHDPDTDTVTGEPTEAALVRWAVAQGLSPSALRAQYPRVAEAPFDSERKMMSTLHADGSSVVQYTKGAPDVLLPLCDRIWIDGRAEPMTDAHRAEIAARNHAMTGSALRVLAAAMRTYDALPGDTSPAALEQHLCFLGLTGMIDPVRPEVVDAIRACRSAGIRPVMITGDHVDTAKAIAEKLGLELQIDDMDFDAALLSVQQGKADIVMAGVTVTDERKAVMDFSDSYATGIQSIIVPNGSDIASPDDLAGKKIGTQRGTTGYIYCSDDFGDDAVVAYDDGLTAVQALNNGQVDAVVIDNAPAKEYVAANPGLVILDTSYAEEDYAIGMAKGSALEDAVNAALEELKADGTLQSIVDKYITAE